MRYLTRRSGASLAAILAATTAHAQTPAVMTEIPVTHSLVAQVMGDLGTPDLLLDRGADPHHFQLRPSQARALAQAGLVVWMGPDLTPWLARATDTLSDAQVLELLEVAGTQLQPYAEAPLMNVGDHDHSHGHSHGHSGDHADDHDDHGHEEGHGHAHDDHAHEEDHGHAHDDHAHEEGHGHAHDDHAHEEGHGHAHDNHAHEEGHGHAHDDHAHEEGHGHAHDDHAHEEDHGHDHDDHAHEEGHGHTHDHHHGDVDPHAWLNPDNALVWLGAIAAELSALDPENADTYQANAQAAQARITELKAEIETILAPASQTGIVMYHDAYGYLAESFGLNMLGSVTLGDAAAPGAARLSTIRASLEQAGAECIFPEVNHPDAYVTLVTEDSALRIGRPLDPAGTMLEPGPALYETLMREMAQAIADCATDS